MRRKWPIAVMVGMVLGGGVQACSQGSPEAQEPEVPTLNKFSQELPKPVVPAPEPVNEVTTPPPPTVADVLDDGCSTTVVQGLSEQIIAEGNCLVPGAYAKLPDELPQVEKDASVFPYLREPARDALVKALEKRKKPLKINSMLRTVAQQYLLYDWYRRGRCGIKLAAEPGSSNHQSGLAIDISAPKSWRKSLESEGFRWLGKKDRWHFDYVGEGADSQEGLDVQAFQRLWNRNNIGEEISDDGDWGPDTEAALRRAPADGFELGAACDDR